MIHTIGKYANGKKAISRIIKSSRELSLADLHSQSSCHPFQFITIQKLYLRNWVLPADLLKIHLNSQPH